MYIDSGKAPSRLHAPVPIPEPPAPDPPRKARGRLSKRIAAWWRRRRIERAVRHLDDRLRADIGLPRPDNAFTKARTFL